ncbi:hypothetical protein G7046_g4171 [Stylonectria norvegica]|nr:hypothetical protein G7046_g4171 [Stylonectria norvegica]
MKLESREGIFPEYAILSHTWGADEVLFNDITDETRWQASKERGSAGYQKIVQSCNVALQKTHDYIWIDTCCIDKSSSAELSEAINSMFRWYSEATICITYLSDVTLAKDGHIEGFTESRWFRRGWTLQELLAPQEIEFFDRNWQSLGTRSSRASLISEATGILVKQVKSNSWADVLSQNIATRMNWAAGRETTRVEDMAYCIMGIFDVNMPLLYGEGEKAFKRLQEEILKVSCDQSILFWRLPKGRNPSRTCSSCLADSPQCFDRGIGEGLEGPCVCSWDDRPEYWLAVLDCTMSRDDLARPAILLQEEYASTRTFKRATNNFMVAVGPDRSGVYKNARHKKIVITYDSSKFKREAIILQTKYDDWTQQNTWDVRFQVKLKPQFRIQKRELWFNPWTRYEPVADHPFMKCTINGGVFLSHDSGLDFLVWWGLKKRTYTLPNKALALQSHGDDGHNADPVCLMQDLMSLTYSDKYNDDSLRDHARKVTNIQYTQATQKTWRYLSMRKWFDKQAMPSTEATFVGGLRMRASIKLISFMGQNLYELTVEVL